MKQKKNLWSDVSKLIVAVLAIMAFLRGKAQFIAYVIAFTVWSAHAVYHYLVPYIKEKMASREAKQFQKQYEKQAQQQKITVDLDISDPMYLVLLRHASYRISDYLQSIYPDATWSWCCSNPEKIVAKGGTGRIKLNGVADFNYAEVTLDQNAKITCHLLNIVPMGKEKQDDKTSEKNETKPAVEVNPQVWFEEKGKKVLTSLIADLHSRGHSSLTIKEDGTVVIKQDDRDITKRAFDSMPDKVAWPRLKKVIEGSGIATEITDGGLVLSW